MKVLFLICVLVSLVSHTLVAQTPGEWTWMNGNPTTNGQAVYGTMGTPSVSNNPGGNSFYESACWTDLEGNFWMYGGSVEYNIMELWKYNVNSNTWTWMKGPGLVPYGTFETFGTQGVFGESVQPSSISCGNHASWVDLNGDLWLLTQSMENDEGVCMWKYSISLNQWAWMHGNMPGNIGTIGIASPMNNPYWQGECPISWTSNDGGLWYFNGFVSNAPMWRFDTSTNMWVCMNNSDQEFTSIIGTVGQYAQNNHPGPNAYYNNWKSDDGTFYTRNNDAMWQFDPSINQWRVVHHNGAASQLGLGLFFTSSCSFNEDNYPIAFSEHRCSWKDKCNRFYGFHSPTIYCFDPAINQYAFSSQFDLTNQCSTMGYGTQGVSSPLNSPCSNQGAPYWTDLDGNFWMTDIHLEEDPTGEFFLINSSSVLWRYVPDYACFSSNTNTQFTTCSQQGCTPFTVNFTPQQSSGNTNTYHWDFGDLSSTSDTSNLAFPSYTFTSAGTYTVCLIQTGTGGCESGIDTTYCTITVLPAPNATILATPNPVSSSDPIVTISTPTFANQTFWYYNAALISQLESFTHDFTQGEPGNYEFELVQINEVGCTDTARITVIVEDDLIFYVPNSFTPDGDVFNETFTPVLTAGIDLSSYKIEIFDRWGGIVFESKDAAESWDGTYKGKVCKDDVYSWKIRFKSIYNDKMFEYQGHVTLVR